MRLQLSTRKKQSGFGLCIVVFFAAISLLVLEGVFRWTENNTYSTDRNNRYFAAVAAAEASTEKVLGMVSEDFQTDGESIVYGRLSAYRAGVPLGSESYYWNSWEFGNAQGTWGANYVERTVSWQWTELNSEYAGLSGMASTYRIVSNARSRGSRTNIVAGVRQDFQVAQIPIFQFAIFYGLDMEISCGQPFNVTGRVHANKGLWTLPDSALTFQSHVTAVGDILFARMPGDSRGAPAGTVTYSGAHDAKVGAMTLPIGTNNTPAAVHMILEVPPVGEDPNSPMGKQRYYNKADLILNVSNTNIVAKSGLADGFLTTISWSNNIAKFVSTNAFFTDAREADVVRPVDINVGALKAWSTTNIILRTILGRDVRVIYVNDKRTLSSGNLGGVRVLNGATLPDQGLTVATEKPIYVQGDYNAPVVGHRGTTNTTATEAASLVGDSITLLSNSWTDANSTSALASRNASSTTVNAAFIGGIVETATYNNYSGGAENFLRFMETWGSSRISTYNGSMVILFPSRYATSQWGLGGVYTPPARNWAFDLNFMDSTKLPPGTPEVRALIRGYWTLIQPGRTS